MYFEIAFIFLIILFLFFKHLRSSKLGIPEHFGIPFVGFLINFRNSQYEKKLSLLKQTLGGICKVQMGSCIWLNDYRLIREAWSKSVFCGRPRLPGITMRTHGFTGGIIFNDGKDFEEQRRFTVKHLKDFGLGKSSMENIINEECSKIIQTIREYENNPISTRHLFNIASLNVLWTIVTGESYGHHDEGLLKLTGTLSRNMELQGGTMLAFFMPWLAKWFPKLVGWTTYLEDSNEIFEFWRSYANKRIETFEVSKNYAYTNFVDFYIHKITNCCDPTSSFYEGKGELSLAATLQDLFIAGSETTATTLSWIFLYLAAFQDYQAKLHHEIDVILESREPTVMDRRLMPMTEAFIMETMRLATLAPLGMIHCAQDTTTLQGFNIPKGSLIHANLCAAHRDFNAWKNPDMFWPERFLSSDQEKVLQHDAFLAFSFGKRGCPGEALAKNEVFIFIVRILNHFQVHSDSAISTIDLSPQMGVSASPLPHKLVFQLRNRL